MNISETVDTIAHTTEGECKIDPGYIVQAAMDDIFENGTPDIDSSQLQQLSTKLASVIM